MKQNQKLQEQRQILSRTDKAALAVLGAGTGLVACAAFAAMQGGAPVPSGVLAAGRLGLGACLSSGIWLAVQAIRSIAADFRKQKPEQAPASRNAYVQPHRVRGAETGLEGAMKVAAVLNRRHVRMQKQTMEDCRPAGPCV